MNYEQVKGSGDRTIAVLVGMALTWAYAKGWIGEKDMAALALAIPVIITFSIGLLVNRRTSIAKSATNLGDVVISTPEIAKATPDNPNIISNTSSPAKIAAVVADAKAIEPVTKEKKDE